MQNIFFINSKQTNLFYNTVTPETMSNVVLSNCFILFTRVITIFGCHKRYFGLSTS